jgi:hypothetical protein
MLSFDIPGIFVSDWTYNGKLYQLGVFGVTDTNSMLLIAGYALMSEPTAETISRVFRNFIELYKKAPACIITDDDPTINKAISMLQQGNLFNGHHIIDPWQILNTIEITADFKTLNQK